MERMKYIFLVLFLTCMHHLVSSHSYATCQAAKKKSFWNNLFPKGCNNPEGSWWDCVQDFASSKSYQPDFLEKCKSTLQCFSWEAFVESSDPEEKINLPLENLIDFIEFFIIDFTQFYIEYVSNIITTIWKLKILNFLINPATIFLLALFTFYKLFFMPILRNIQTEIEFDEDEFTTTCNVVDGILELQDNIEISAF